MTSNNSLISRQTSIVKYMGVQYVHKILYALCVIQMKIIIHHTEITNIVNVISMFERERRVYRKDSSPSPSHITYGNYTILDTAVNTPKYRLQAVLSVL